MVLVYTWPFVLRMPASQQLNLRTAADVARPPVSILEQQSTPHDVLHGRPFMKLPATHSRLLFPAIALLLSGCAGIPAHRPVGTPLVQTVRHTCIQEGARPRTPLFYHCVAAALQQRKRAEALARCDSPAMHTKITEECRQSDAIGDADYGRRMKRCRQDLTALCKQLVH